MNAAHAGDDNQKESLASLLTDTPSVSAESITAWLSRVAAEAEAPSLASAISKLSEHSTSSTPCPKSKKRRLSNSEAPSETPPITTKRQRNFPEDLPVNIIGNVTPSSQYPATPTSNTGLLANPAPSTPKTSTSPHKPVSSVDDATNTSKKSLFTDKPSLRWGTKPYDVGKAMESHGLFHNNRAAYNRHPTFKNKIHDIVHGERKSTIQSESIERFQDHREAYRGLNEDTLLHHLLPLIIKGIYTSNKPLSEEEQALMEEAGHPSKEWFTDGLMVTHNSEFRRTLVPNRYLDGQLEKYLAEAMAKKDGMKNPKPDMTYGIRTNKYPIPNGVIVKGSTNALLEIASGMHHAFMIIEAKADRGEYDEATNQARRGGATLVNAARQLRSLVEAAPVIISGVDDTCVVFSATINPQLMEVWVHWCEVEADLKTCNYHMNTVASHALGDDLGVGALRRTLHNILEWGCIGRFTELEKLHESIHAYELREAEKIGAESQAAAEIKSDNKRKMPNS